MPRWVGLPALAALAGCTSLSVTELPPAEPAPTNLTAGAVYHLAAALVSPAANLTIKDCRTDTGLLAALHDYPSEAAKPITQVVFSVTADITTEIVPDRTLVIDCRRMTTFLKTSSCGLERYPNGTLKSFNASIEDQSVEAAVDLVAAAGAAAVLSTGAGAAILPAAAAGVAATGAATGRRAAGSKAPPPPPLRLSEVRFAACTADTLRTIHERTAATTAREEAANALGRATAAFAALNPAPGAGDAAAAQKLAGLKGRIAQLSLDVDEASAAIDAANAKLTLPLEAALDASGKEIGDGAGHVPPSALPTGVTLTANAQRLAMFVKAHFVTATGRVDARHAEEARNRDCLKGDGDPADETCSSDGQIAAVIRDRIGRVVMRGGPLAPLQDPASHAPTQAALVPKRDAEGRRASEVKAGEGLIYIEPRPVRIRMSMAAIGADRSIREDRTLKTVDLSIPQLGDYLSLPVRAGVGEKVVLSATFGEDGRLLTAAYANPKAAAKTLTAGFRSAAEGASATADAVEDRKVKLTKDRADIIAGQVSVQESLAKLRPTVDPLADINAALAKVNAQAALAEALVRIKTADAALIP